MESPFIITTYQYNLIYIISLYLQKNQYLKIRKNLVRRGAFELYRYPFVSNAPVDKNIYGDVIINTEMFPEKKKPPCKGRLKSRVLSVISDISIIPQTA